MQPGGHYIVWLFQFHKGTIKTKGLSQASLFQNNFNSIKVRLKHLSCKHITTTDLFQFHKGTIKT